MQINKIVAAFLTFLMLSAAQASKPVWTIVPLTDTTVMVPPNGKAIVQYLVTNQSTRMVHTLNMLEIAGIKQITSGPGICNNPCVLQPKGYCTLSLLVTGSLLPQLINANPVICENGSHLECYQAVRA